MNGPRHDRHDPSGKRTEPTGAESATSAPEDTLLVAESIILDGPKRDTRADAITRAGELLVRVGAVDASYVEAMHAREEAVSTYMGNLLAIPHGTNDAKSSIWHTAISFVRYPEPLDWDGKEVSFVIGIAGAGDDHLELLGQIAEVFIDETQMARLVTATTSADVLAILGAPQEPG